MITWHLATFPAGFMNSLRKIVGNSELNAISETPPPVYYIYMSKVKMKMKMQFPNNFKIKMKTTFDIPFSKT